MASGAEVTLIEKIAEKQRLADTISSVLSQ
jgi:hypothetical protein